MLEDGPEEGRKGKKCRTYLARKASKEKAPKDYRLTAFTKLNIFIPATKSKAKVLPYWEDTVSDRFIFFHGMNESFCIILLDDTGYDMNNQGDFPEHFRTWKTFLKFENEVLMGMLTPSDRSRKLVCSI